MIATPSWEQDFAERMNPALMTALFHQAVPITAHLGYRIVEVDEGYAQAILPLGFEAANQHGTHAAATMAHAADVTGGVALGSLLRGVPFVGLHPKTTTHAAAMWAGTIRMQYLLPSADDLVITARVEPERFDEIRSAYHDGELLVEEVEIRLASGERLIARGRIRYFLTQSDLLEPQAPGEEAGVLFNHRMRSSARLVAALRGREAQAPEPLYVDPYSAVAGGKQGALLAARFLHSTPQLGSMIAARTRDIDDLVLARPQRQQLVLLGVGFDCRPFRLADRVAPRVFEVDLPHMLSEREAVLRAFEPMPPVDRVPVALNLELDDLALALRERGFDPTLETLFVLEGTSMYFSEESNSRLLATIAGLMGSAHSRLWIDIVADAVVHGRDTRPEITQFIDGMTQLGEPFVFGRDDSTSLFEQAGLEVVRTTPSGSVLGPRATDIHGYYTFFELRRPRR